MTAPVIALSALQKNYGPVQALRGLDVEVPPGPVGLLGPNGAGKTTLIKLLLGLLEPTSGQADIVGCDPTRKSDRLEIRRRVGFMPEGDCLLPDMSGVELVSTLGRISGLGKQDAMTRAHEVLDYVELEEARYRPLVQYSTGMKQRLKLAQSLVHDPEVLLLDEPTNGLDPKGRRHMLELVHDLGHTQDKNILLCSHILPDVEKTCEHVVVLHKGRVVESGTMEEMTRSDGLTLHVEVEGDREAFTRGLTEAGYRVEPREEGRLAVVLEQEASDADAMFAVAARTGVAITYLDEVRSTLEEVFLRALESAEDGVQEPAGSAEEAVA